MANIEHGPVVGEHRDKEINEWFIEGSSRFDFVRIAKEDRRGCVSLDQLQRGEVVIAPGLIYKRSAIAA